VEPSFVRRRAASPLNDSMTSTPASAECILATPPLLLLLPMMQRVVDGKWRKRWLR